MAWTAADTAVLARAELSFRPLDAVIGEAGLDAAQTAARTWARSWGRIPVRDGQSLRDLVPWRDTSLLWLGEGFIRHATAGPGCAQLAETALRLLESTRAEEVDAAGLGASEAVLLSRACTVGGVLFHGPVPPARALGPTTSPWRGRIQAFADLFAPAGPAPRPGPSALLLLAGPGAVIPDLRPLLDALEAALGWPATVVRVADLERRATRKARQAARQAATRLRECRDHLRGTPGLLASYSHRGVGFADLAAHDLDRLLLGHLPSAVGRFEATLELVAGPGAPRMAVLADCSRDDRRGLVAACGHGGVPAVVLLTRTPGPDDVDRDDGGPRAEATVVWEPGSDPSPAVARLRESARLSRARVERG